jgi:hypothetical protein
VDKSQWDEKSLVVKTLKLIDMIFCQLSWMLDKKKEVKKNQLSKIMFLCILIRSWIWSRA